MSDAAESPGSAMPPWMGDVLHERAVVEIAALSRKIRKRRLVAFFGRMEFSDNSKYTFLRAVARERNYDVVWVAPNQDLATRLAQAGLPVLDLTADADRAVSTLLHAAVAIFCVNPNESTGWERVLSAAVDGARKVQLWHGVSAKHLVLQLVDHLTPLDVRLREPWELNTRADYVLSTSEELDGYWREVFGCRSLIRGGLPRNELLRRDPVEWELLGAELPDVAARALAKPGRPKVLIVPTWQRHTHLTLTSRGLLAEMSSWAQARGADIFLKLHPVYTNAVTFDRPTFGPGCYVLASGVDIYPWLRLFDALVTDYSSIMFDFLLTGKPVARLDLPPGSHESFEPDFTLVPGGVDFAYTFTSTTLRRTFDTMLSRDTLGPARAAAAARLFPTDPGSACDDVLDVVDNLVEEAVADDWVVVN